VAADLGLPAHLRELLTVSGVDPNLSGRGSAPPLILAALAGHYDVIRVLRQHKDKNGK
jgi:ankyrin repeat protein